MEWNGRCVGCGFLSKAAKQEAQPGVTLPPSYFEAELPERESGKLYQHVTPYRLSVITVPFCFRRQANLDEEICAVRNPQGHGYTPASTLEVLNRDRKCPKWFPYTSGRDPKEHLEEWKMNELELKRQAFEQQMATDPKSLMRKLDSSNKRVQLILGFVLGGIAIIEIIVGLLQVLYPAGFPWLQNLFGIKPPAPPSVPPTPGI